jgi:hypothetical protein
VSRGTQRGRKIPKAGRSWKASRIPMLLLSAKSSRRQRELWKWPSMKGNLRIQLPLEQNAAQH